MMTIHLRDHAGEPMRQPDGRPVTITVGLDQIALPAGARVISMPGTRKAHRRAAREAPPIATLERLAAHVRAWDGFRCNDEVISTPTRDLVVRMFQVAPWLRQQVEDAVRDVTQLGLI